MPAAPEDDPLGRYRRFWDESLERIAEIAAREQHQRELRIARDVQQRLFPQERPPVPGLEYAGACRPALEVGGDYYDFVKLSEHEFGIAIGDVSGKGISASLLMATLRAYLHGRLAGEIPDLPTMVADLNRFVYESSDPNRYATFFYAQHAGFARSLTYVNAGHNPALLFRGAGAAAGAPPVRLAPGGPVIGLLPDCDYVQAEVALESGDLLVAYTDGISEATNDAGAEWGEEGLIEAIRRCRSGAPVDVIADVMATVDGFVGDAPQADDMTLVVVRAV
jgi:sigma-B regulation protein RsbU (phosphoserine phosphatase)